MDGRHGIDCIKVWNRSLIDANLEGQVGVNIHIVNIKLQDQPLQHCERCQCRKTMRTYLK